VFIPAVLSLKKRKFIPGGELKHFRHKYEMNQKEFAEFLGVTQYQH